MAWETVAWTDGLGKDSELQAWIFQQHQEIHRIL